MKLIWHGYLILNLGIFAHETSIETSLKLHYFGMKGASFCREIFFTILIFLQNAIVFLFLRIFENEWKMTNYLCLLKPSQLQSHRIPDYPNR